MILIQIALTIIVVLYCLAVPMSIVHDWSSAYLEGDDTPFKTALKQVDVINVICWFIFGMMIVGALYELWKI